MPSYGLSRLYLTSLSTDQLTTLASDTVDKVSSFTLANNKELLLAGQLVKLRGALLAYQKAQQGKKTTSTAGQLEAADRDRDQALATFTAFVRANAYIKSDSVKAAYTKLTTLLKSYKTTGSKGYEEETAELKRLIAQLKSSDYQPAVTALGLTTHLTTLDNAQTSFDRLYAERLNEQSKANPGQLKTLRKDLETSYTVVADVIALHSYCQPDNTAYADLLKAVNTIRSRY